jgi:hypothetical protein
MATNKAKCSGNRRRSVKRTKRVQTGGTKLFSWLGKFNPKPPNNKPSNMNTAFAAVRQIAGSKPGNKARIIVAEEMKKNRGPKITNAHYQITTGNAIRASPNPNNAARAMARMINPKSNQILYISGGYGSNTSSNA